MRGLVAFFAVTALAFGFVLGSATPALAEVTGGCTAQATATTSPGIDITTKSEWHLKNTDVVSGSGTAPSDQTTVTVSAWAMGVPVPVLNSTGNNGRSGSAGPYAVSSYSWIAKVIPVSGKSDTCSGSLTVYLDDVNPLLTAVGGGGAALGVIGLLLMAGTAFGRGGAAARIAGGIWGLVAGIGFGLLATQASLLDPRSPVGLAFPVVGLLLGAISAGALRRGGGPPKLAKTA
jgi:hypothetical protein